MDGGVAVGCGSTAVPVLGQLDLKQMVPWNRGRKNSSVVAVAVVRLRCCFWMVGYSWARQVGSIGRHVELVWFLHCSLIGMSQWQVGSIGRHVELVWFLHCSLIGMSQLHSAILDLRGICSCRISSDHYWSYCIMVGKFSMEWGTKNTASLGHWRSNVP